MYTKAVDLCKLIKTLSKSDFIKFKKVLEDYASDRNSITETIINIALLFKEKPRLLTKFLEFIKLSTDRFKVDANTYKKPHKAKPDQEDEDTFLPFMRKFTSYDYSAESARHKAVYDYVQKIKNGSTQDNEVHFINFLYFGHVNMNKF
ncbi:hypothetical protein A3Q56_02555 [Intoshia linei]|uniref:Uncharacterized protein n=1 Tax=Intoshia linei TaxID=1819745 RepID=A0A177B698_9BILA|nr:hypothetical protein A3Q56_02555 [Intoshia linei]